MKKCNKCGIEKESDKFIKDKRNKDGRGAWCQECANKNSARWHQRKRPEYHVWYLMRYRCNNEKAQYFNRYGGRGIKVCDRWMDSFDNFFDDMGSRPTAKHQIDRIDNDGNYCPENCRWVTPMENIRNSTAAKITQNIADEIRVVYDVSGHTMDHIAKQYGVCSNTVWRIVNDKAWVA